MAGHSQFKNIMHRKGAQDAKRAKQFTKLIREITTAAKQGGLDPEFNPRLRTAINAARTGNLPKDRIENALNKANSADEANLDEVVYECYAPGGVALIITGLTDNRNRTAGEVKAIMNKNGATLAEPGSVSYMFNRVGMFYYERSDLTADNMLEIAIEAGADDCQSLESTHTIYCPVEEYHTIYEALTTKIGQPHQSGLIWKAQNEILVTNSEHQAKLEKLVDALEDNDDVQDVYGNYVYSS